MENKLSQKLSKDSWEYKCNKPQKVDERRRKIMAIELKGIGRLTKDIELETKKTKNGEMDFCQMSVAFDNGKDKDGNSREATFINFDVWGKNATNAAKYIEKGSQVSVDATITNNNYEKDGQKFYGNKYTANKIEFLGRKKGVDNKKNIGEELPF